MKLCIINISNICGLNCNHCYLEHNNKPKELSALEAERIFSSLSKLCVEIVALEGDHSDIISIVEIAKKFNLRLTINASAYGIDEKIIDKLVGQVRSIVFSLDGYKADYHDVIRGKSGVFSRTIDLVKYSKQKGIDISLTSALSKSNLSQIEGIVSLAAELGVDRLSFLYTTPLGKAKKSNISLSLNSWRDTCNLIKSLQLKYPIKLNYEPVICGEIQDKQFCSAINHQYLAIDVEGNVYFCPLLIGHIEYSLGNIFENELSIISEPNNIAKLYDKKIYSVNCVNCKDSISCAGVCFIHSTDIMSPLSNSLNYNDVCCNTTPLCYIYWEGINYYHEKN